MTEYGFLYTCPLCGEKKSEVPGIACWECIAREEMRGEEKEDG